MFGSVRKHRATGGSCFHSSSKRHNFRDGLITATLLFAQFAILSYRPFLIIASGYLFTALLVIPHALSFPGAFSPTGLLGAGPQTPAWLYIFWHVGFPIALLIYSLSRGRSGVKDLRRAQNRLAIVWSVAIVIVLAYGLTFVAIVGDEFHPPQF